MLTGSCSLTVETKSASPQRSFSASSSSSRSVSRSTSGARRSMVERSKRLPSERRWQVCSGALSRARVVVISRVAIASHCLESSCLSCQARSGASQLRPRRTWLQVSNPVTKYPFHGARTTSPIVRSSASIPYGSACPSGELSLRSRPMTARRPSGVLLVPPVMLTQSSLT
ncbi:hypothetical protein GA0115255_114648 [Streptomyces sp. Ncost-T6T-2b]|nr:hypothetical protein GA0115255_114648 [Streptomyces sp. Ncost-T6T-2b]